MKTVKIKADDVKLIERLKALNAILKPLLAEQEELKGKLQEFANGEPCELVYYNQTKATYQAASRSGIDKGLALAKFGKAEVEAITKVTNYLKLHIA